MMPSLHKDNLLAGVVIMLLGLSFIISSLFKKRKKNIN